MRHSSIRTLQLGQPSGSEFINVLLCDSSSLNSYCFECQCRDWNWVRSNSCSNHCPSAVCHCPKYSDHDVDCFLVPSALRFQSDFTSSEYTVCNANETFCTAVSPPEPNSMGPRRFSSNGIVVTVSTFVLMIPCSNIAVFSTGPFDGLTPFTAFSVVTSALHISAIRFLNAMTDGSVSLFNVISRYPSMSMNFATLSIVHDSSTPFFNRHCSWCSNACLLSPQCALLIILTLLVRPQQTSLSRLWAFSVGPHSFVCDVVMGASSARHAVRAPVSQVLLRAIPFSFCVGLFRGPALTRQSGGANSLAPSTSFLASSIIPSSPSATLFNSVSSVSST